MTKKGDLVAIPKGEDSFAITPKAEKPKNKGGRPSLYTQELADEICSRLADGESLRKICRDDAMPEGRTVWKWLRKHEEFVQQYARAKEEAADSLAEDIQNIADKTLSGDYEPQASRVAIDAYKWTASKLKPKKYGDKIDHTTNGKDMPMPIISLPNATVGIQSSLSDDVVPEITG